MYLKNKTKQKTKVKMQKTNKKTKTKTNKKTHPNNNNKSFAQQELFDTTEKRLTFEIYYGYSTS